MLRSNGKRISILVAAVAVVITLYCAVFWRSFVVRYHVSVLREDPGYLEQLLELPDETTEALAVREYLRDEDGRSSLLELYLESGPFRIESLRDGLDRVYQGLMAPYGDARFIWLNLDAPTGGGLYGQYNMNFRFAGDSGFNQSLVVAAWKWLEVVAGEPIFLARYPALRFTILPRDAGNDRLDRKAQIPESVGQVCLIERRPREAAPALVEALQSADEPARIQAALDVLAIPEEAAPFSRTLSGRLDDPSEAVRLVIVRVLAKIGVPAMAHIAESLKHPKSQVRELAAAVLERMGPTARDAAGDLAKLFRDEDWPLLPIGALVAMGRFSVPHLVDALEGENARSRLYAADVLARIGAEAKDATAGLKALLDDPDPVIRLAAANTLVAVGSGGDDLVPVAVELTRTRELRTNAAIAAAEYFQLDLGMFAPGQLLLELGRLGSAATVSLEQLLTDRDPFVRAYGAWALGRLGAASRSASPELSARLKDASELWYVRAYAAHALAGIGPSDEAIEAVTEAVTADHVVVRRESIRALGAFGAAATTALPILARARRSDRARRNREVAAEAITRIEYSSARSSTKR